MFMCHDSLNCTKGIIFGLLSARQCSGPSCTYCDSVLCYHAQTVIIQLMFLSGSSSGHVRSTFRANEALTTYWGLIQSNPLWCCSPATLAIFLFPLDYARILVSMRDDAKDSRLLHGPPIQTSKLAFYISSFLEEKT